MSGDVVRLFIRDCRVNLPVGIFDSEMRHTQPIVITLECEARLTRRYDDIADHDMTHIINYAPYYHFIREELPQMGHIYLLESVAEKILDFCFRDPRIETARARVEKTSIFPDAAGAGIELYRTRT